MKLLPKVSHLGCALLLLVVQLELGQSVFVQQLGHGHGTWTVTNANKSIHVPATIPGSIYSDLERAKLIPDIYRDRNDVDLRWVSYDTWTYELRFDLADDSLLWNHNHVYLTAHGLDTVASVSLNGKQLAEQVDNMFVRHRWDVKSALKKENNTVLIKFESAPKVAKERQDKVTKEHYSIPPISVPSDQNGENSVQLLRKMQASFSWDWGPAFPTAGIWRELTLEAFNSTILRSVSVATETADHKAWSLNYSAFFEGAPLSEISGSLVLQLDGNLLEEQQISGLKTDANGEARFSHLVAVRESLNIKPWFPNGVGEQKLYDLAVVFRSDGAKTETIGQYLKIGFRTIKLVQDKLPSKEEAYSFYFKVNDLPIFAKGSNWIPAHVLNEALSKEYIRDLLHSAKQANLNMLRVWGGGIYETDWFYEAADEFGILIWHDMMFACATYPTDAKFLNSVKTEIRQQIRRLQHHSSIALWAGNNENEAALADGWWGETKNEAHSKDYDRDYRTLYLDTIGPIIEHEDHTRPYLPSSPSNGILEKAENYLSLNPSSLKSGDVHFYIFYGDVWDWQVNPSAKFASEFGYQSWASLQTLESAIQKEHLKYPLDDMLKHRQHKPGGLEALDGMLLNNLKLPSANGTEANLVDYIYITQVWQAMAIKLESEFYRRNRFVDYETGYGNTMGALYWQLNDIWPTVSWASTEFGGKWKMLHYFVEDFFENLLVVAYLDKTELKVDVIRDDHELGPKNYTLVIDVFDWSQLKSVGAHKVEVSADPFNVTHVFSESLDKFLNESNCKSKANCLVEVSLLQGTEIKSKNFLFVDQPKNAIGLRKPNIKIEVSGPKSGENGSEIFTLKLTTEQLAPFVWLDFAPGSTILGHFSDNGIMLTSASVEVTFVTNQKITAEKLTSELTVKALQDVQ